MSLNSFNNSTSWELITGSKSMLIATLCKKKSKPKLILVNYSSSMTIQPTIQKVWTPSRVSVVNCNLSYFGSKKSLQQVLLESIMGYGYLNM
jgi:hypothetical protein